MKKICPNLHNKQVANDFGELKDLFGEDTAYLLWSKNNGHSIDKAPNGADSILFQSLLDRTKNRQQALIEKAKIYSDNFLKWFGDWTSNDNANVSKVVDKNGEPLIVYHYTTEHFNTFDLSFFGQSDQGDLGEGFYVTPTSPEEDANKHYNYFTKGYGNIVMPLFVNIKNPISKEKIKELGIYWFTRRKKPYKSHKEELQKEIKRLEFEIDDYNFKLFGDDPDYSYYRELDSIAHEMTVLKLNNAKSKLNEVKQKLSNINEDYDINKDYNLKIEKLKQYDGVINGDFEILVPSANQIKSAIGNSGQFSQHNDDIYKSAQGESNIGVSSRLSNIPSKGDISILQQYLKSHRKGVSSTALKLVMSAVNRYFDDKQTGITYEIVDTLPGGEAAHYDRADKVIRINKNANFRNESKSTTPEVQTIVHEMLHAITEHAIHNDSRVRKSFTDLYQKTKKALGKDAQDYGLSDVYEFVAELSNAQFVEKLKSIQYNRKQTLFEKIKQAIKKIYSQIFTSYKDFIGSDNVYEAAVNDLFTVMSHNEQKEDNITDKEDKDRLASIQASEDKVNQIHHRITELFQGLYKDYKKQLNKGANRQRREDQLWSTIQELKSQ